MKQASKATEKILLFINRATSKALKKHYGVNTDLNRYLNWRRKKNGGVRVSEHALLRYFERMEGYNIEAIITEISGRAKIKHGVNKQTVGDMTLIVEGDTVVTLYKYEPHTGNKIRFVKPVE